MFETEFRCDTALEINPDIIQFLHDPLFVRRGSAEDAYINSGISQIDTCFDFGHRNQHTGGGNQPPGDIIGKFAFEQFVDPGQTIDFSAILQRCLL